LGDSRNGVKKRENGRSLLGDSRFKLEVVSGCPEAVLIFVLAHTIEGFIMVVQCHSVKLTQTVPPVPCPVTGRLRAMIMYLHHFFTSVIPTPSPQASNLIVKRSFRLNFMSITNL
jgi:hypothetical protein